MQKYENQNTNHNLGKKILSDFLGFLKYKVDNDLLTIDEISAIKEIVMKEIPLSGTSEDFAKYYHQSPINVRSVINRKLLAKPKRKVLYPFLEFSEIIPEKWK